MLNKVLLLGRVGKKYLKELKGGGNMTTLAIATNKRYVDSQGKANETTTWHNVNFFSKLADVAGKYTNVGDLVYLEGEVIHKEIVGKDGVKKWAYSVTGSEIKLLPNKDKPKNDGPFVALAPLKEDKEASDDFIPF